MHRPEDSVASRLQWHVEVVSEATCRRKEFDNVPCDVLWLNRAQTQSLQACLVENAAEKSNQLAARRQIAAPGSKVDSTQHNLTKSGFGKPSNLTDRIIRRHAARLTPDKRNHAIRTTKVASILNF